MKHRDLYILPVYWIPCDVCQQDCYHFKQCVGPFVYCSLTCYAILYLEYMNKTTFDDWGDMA